MIYSCIEIHEFKSRSRLTRIKVKIKNSFIFNQNKDTHLRYANDTTLMAESEAELKSLLLRVKGGSEKADLKLNI